MTARSYPTPNDIHETGIVRDRQLGECVNATFTSSQDNLNVASTSNTTPTDPRATNPTSGQAIPATGPLKQQCCSRYHPNSGPHPRRRGRSLGDVGHQVSHHQYHAQGPSRIPSQASTTSHSSSFQARTFRVFTELEPSYFPCPFPLLFSSLHNPVSTSILSSKPYPSRTYTTSGTHRIPQLS